MMQSREQQYMKIAFAMVEDAESRLSADKESYASRVKSAPVLIHNSGLMQTLAFYISKKKKEQSLDLLSRHLLSWLNHGFYWASYRDEDQWNLFADLKDKTSDELMLDTERTMALLQWLKRFSEGRLAKVDSTGTEESGAEGE